MATFPSFEVREYSIGTNPSGNRNGSGGGFIGVKSTTVGGTLIFSPLNVTTSGGITETHLILGRVNSFGDASGVYNLKFFLTSTSAFTEGTFRFLEYRNRHFIINRSMSEADADTPQSIPSTPNWLSTYQTGVLSGVREDDVTEYRYLGFLSREDTPTHVYGGPGLNSFRYRVLYSFS